MAPLAATGCWCAGTAAELFDPAESGLLQSQVKALKSQQTKFGTVLVVETLPQPQRLLLGFHINPLDKLQKLLHLTTGLLQHNRGHPKFGICADHIIDPDVLATAAPEEEEPPLSEYASTDFTKTLFCIVCVSACRSSQPLVPRGPCSALTIEQRCRADE